MSRGRRQFCRSLAGLACAGFGACKIEPRVDIEERGLGMGEQFPDPPAQIPDALESAESSLRALTEAMLERELPLLESDLRVRSAEDPQVVNHLIEVMNNFGLTPAANRGGWLQPVALEIVEPAPGSSGMRVGLRLEGAPSLILPAAAAGVGPGPGAPPPASPPDEAEAKPSPDAPPLPGPEADPPDADAGPDAALPDVDVAAEPSPELLLTPIGAFRQRSSAEPHEALPLSPLLSLESPLPKATIDAMAGRVALFRAPEDLDLASPDAAARVDLIMGVVRDAGAIGCLLLTQADEATIDQFRAAWGRQVRRAGAARGALLLEGLLGEAGGEALEAALADEDTWVLDADLGTQDIAVKSHNVIGRITGRERPDEAVVLTCSWDTTPSVDAELATRRLLTTLAAFHQLAEWSRRSIPPRYSLVLVLTVDAGLSAGHAVHAAWSSGNGAETQALVALSRPSEVPMPIIELAGRYDSGVATLVGNVVAGDGRDLIVNDQLPLPSLAPYIRYKAPIICVGAPDPAALEDRGQGQVVEEEGEGEGGGEDTPAQTQGDARAGLFADVRLLRNLVLRLAEG